MKHIYKHANEDSRLTIKRESRGGDVVVCNLIDKSKIKMILGKQWQLPVIICKKENIKKIN